MLFKQKLTQSDYFLIAANLLPVIGAWFWGWQVREVFVVYCLETIIIGLYNLLKMAIVTMFKGTDTWYNEGSRTQVSGLFFMFFFIMHYGLFVAVQTGLFVQVSGLGKDNNWGFFDFFLHWPSYLGPDAYTVLWGFVISYGFKTLWDFILPKEYKKIPMMLLMFQPYLRIFIQQITVILGGFFLGFGAGKVFILIFAIVKIWFEIFINYEGLLNKSMKDLKEQESGKK